MLSFRDSMRERRCTLPGIDRTDAAILMALLDDPRAPVQAIAFTLGLSRNTVQSRLARLQERGAVPAHGRGADLRPLGYPLTAFIRARVRQSRLAEVAADLALIPEVVEVDGLSGSNDLLVRVVASDSDDLYRVAGKVLALPDVKRTKTSLAMHSLVPYRIAPLLQRLADVATA